MRESAGLLKTLMAFQPDLTLTCQQLAAAWGGPVTPGQHKKAQIYALRYRSKGLLERVNKRHYPATYKLTPAGHQLLINWSFEEQKVMTPKCRSVPVEQTTAPTGLVNSVFSLSLHLNI
jgi:hypothetical protein